MKKDTVPAECPVRRTLSLIGGKWKMLILYRIGEQTLRYGAIKRLIPDISERMLIMELKDLVDSELLIRTSYGEVPPRVDYSLTERGRLTLPLIEQIEKFGLS
ncbi:winged helix-turn-helix transcriptional regulator [Hymenobacter terrenus]|uniref:winged helix-turn-helix transcriptional regulator n=1 Tax=Hymenobacter terrenus TaxID=1629124 RepID=UPI000619DF75|nr:helix-turn-helix domain-containing protein [Hymenobacter terrenus]